jgi:hypothetical protein
MLVVIVLIGGVLILGPLIAATGDERPAYTVAVDQGLEGGDTLSDLPNRTQTVVRPAVSNATVVVNMTVHQNAMNVTVDQNAVNVTVDRNATGGTILIAARAYDELFRSAPTPREFDEEGAVYYIAHRGRVYAFEFTFESPDRYRIELIDRTATVLVEYESLPTDAQRLLERANENGSAVPVSDLPSDLESELGVTTNQGLSLLAADVDRGYLDWNGQYYTVTVSDPTELGSSGGQVGALLTSFLGVVVLVVGLVVWLRSGGGETGD